MKETFQHKTSSVLVSGLIGLIIISFMFTGYESMKGAAPDVIAKVGNRPIKVREYQQEYERQMQFYSNYMFSGNPLTEEQILKFGIRDNTLKSLVSRKLFIHFAERVGVIPSPQEVKEKIKELDYFKTNNQFDLQRYKAVLANARITPTDFEEDIIDQIKAQNAQELLSTFPASETFISDIVKFKSEMVKLNVIQLNRRNLTKFVGVTKEEVEQFLAKPTNLERVKNLFGARKKTLDVEEAVKGRHILLTTQSGKKKIEDIEKEAITLKKSLTTSNFAKIADQKTEDPSGKGKGGALDWFERGQMVPDFERVAFATKPGNISEPIKTSYGFHIIYVEDHRAGKPAVFENHKDSLAREIVQGEKTQALDQLMAKLSKDIKNLLEQNKTAELAAMIKKYELTQIPDAVVNRLDASAGQIKLKADEVHKIFTEKGEKGIFQFDDALSTTMAKKGELNTKDKEAHAIKKEDEIEKFNSQTARKIGQDVIKTLEDKIKVKVFNKEFSS